MTVFETVGRGSNPRRDTWAAHDGGPGSWNPGPTVPDPAFLEVTRPDEEAVLKTVGVKPLGGSSPSTSAF